MALRGGVCWGGVCCSELRGEARGVNRDHGLGPLVMNAVGSGGRAGSLRGGDGQMSNNSKRERLSSSTVGDLRRLAIRVRARAAVVLLMLLAELALGVSPAAAQAANSAEELFEQGVSELRAGAFEAACAALSESYRLDANLGTLLALSDCLDRWGKQKSAASRYGQYVAEASNLSAEERAYRARQLEFARAALARLTPSVPQLIFALPAQATELVVSLDGEPLPLASLEHGVPVDPGRHVIETQATGHGPWRLEVDVASGQRLEVQLDIGAARIPDSPPPAALPPPLPPPLPEAVARAEPQKTPAPIVLARDSVDPAASAWRTLGWGLGGLGVAGLGVGTVAGVMLLQTCPQLDCSSQEERGKSLALVADVGFGVGVAALVASAVLLLQSEAPTARTDTTQWRPLAGVQARGGWVGVSQAW